MNDYALGQFINLVFMPHVPAAVGVVIAITLLILVYVALRDGFLREVSND